VILSGSTPGSIVNRQIGAKESAAQSGRSHRQIALPPIQRSRGQELSSPGAHSLIIADGRVAGPSIEAVPDVPVGAVHSRSDD
jgi:hypothetical protein